MSGRLDIFKAAGLEKQLPPAATPTEAPVEAVVLEDPNKLSREDIMKALPAQLKIRVSDELVDKINTISMDPMIADEIRNNFIGYTHVMKDGKFKVDQYTEACAYVTYKMMGYSNQNAYALTFPDRITRMVADGKDDKSISSFVAAYNRNKLVNIIMEQAIIPARILNQDLFQSALNRQSFLMMNAKSEKVQCDAANSLLNALASPETTKLEIDVAVKDSSGLEELKNIMVEVATNQREQIKAGAPTKRIAHVDIYTPEGNPVE